MDKKSFKQMADEYPDKREYFLDLHEQFELNQERIQAVEKGYNELGLSKEDILDGVRIPKKFLKLLQWYMQQGSAVGEKTNVLNILKTLFELEK